MGKFLIGNFNAKESEFGFEKPSLFDSVTKQQLISTSKDDQYWVINLIDQTFFDPKKNQWISFPKEGGE